MRAFLLTSLRAILRVVACFLILAGGVGLFCFLFLHWDDRQFVKTSRRTNATVVALIPDDRNPGRQYQRCVYTYLDTKGASQKATTWWGYPTGTYHLGQTIPVCYSPSLPAQARINSYTELWQRSSIYGICSAIELVLAAALLGLAALCQKLKHHIQPKEPSP